MSDAVVVALIMGGSSTVVAAIAAIFGYINVRQGKKTAVKVEEYHKAVNGNMEKLIQTTADLGKATGKAEEKQEQADKINNE